MLKFNRYHSLTVAALAIFFLSRIAFGQADPISQLTCNPSSLTSGMVTTCTVTLSAAASAGGIEVLLSSNNTLLPVTGSTTIPAGSNSTTFTATAGSIASNQSATLTATALNSVMLNWTASTSQNLANYNVYRGVSSGGPYSVIANAGLATSYADYNIQNGQSYYYVTTVVSNSGQESAYSNQATAVVPTGISKTATVSLMGQSSATLSSLTCNPTTLNSGAVTTCTVGLSGVAPAGGSIVSLASNNTLLPVSLSVTVASGATSATFTATAGTLTKTQTATLTATLNGVSKTTSISLAVPGGSLPPAITSTTTAMGVTGINFSYQITATNSPSSYGANGLPTGLTINSATGLISGTPTTAGNYAVTLSAANSAGTGTATLALSVNSSYFVQISAKAASSVSSASVSFPANTSPGNLIVVGLDFVNTTTPVSLTDSQGNTFTQVGTQLNSPGGAGSRVYYAKNIKGGADTVTVTLSASSSYLELYVSEYSGLNATNPIDAQAGASGNAGAVTSGSISTTVAGDLIYGYCVGDWACTAGPGFATRSTMNSNLVEEKTAGNPGSYAATGTATSGWTMQVVALKPASAPSQSVVPTSLACTPASLNSGAATTCTVSLNNRAPAGGTTVTLSSNSALLPVPASVAILAGSATATFTATAGSIPSNQSATLTATLNGTSQTAIVNLLVPALLSSLACSPPSLASGASTTCTVTLNNPAPAGGTAVAISDNSTALTTPASVTVPAAATTASFTATADSVASSQSVTVTAKLNTSSLTATVTVAAVAPPVITSSTSANGVVGSAFSYQITASNSPTSFAAAGLPTGLTLNSSSGLISGTPTAAGTSNISLSATNASGIGTASLTLTVLSTYFVQVNAQSAPSASSITLSFSKNTTAGDLILVALDFVNSVTPSSITDSQGNTFTEVGTQLNSPGGAGSRVYYAKNIKGGADTITVTLSGKSNFFQVYATEYSGLSTTSPVDGQAGASGNAGSVSSGTIKTTVAGDLVYGFCVGDSACTVGSGFTARSTLKSNLVEDHTAATAGSYVATGTANSSWSMQAVALKPASAQ